VTVRVAGARRSCRRDAEDLDPAETTLRPIGGSPIAEAREVPRGNEAFVMGSGLRTVLKQHRRRVSPIGDGDLRLRVSSLDWIVMRVSPHPTLPTAPGFRARSAAAPDQRSLVPADTDHSIAGAKIASWRAGSRLGTGSDRFFQ
jgi:hypothetical protein